MAEELHEYSALDLIGSGPDQKYDLPATTLLVKAIKQSNGNVRVRSEASYFSDNAAHFATKGEV